MVIFTAITLSDCIKKMNKQQLAAKIWESANQMRSKIEANEYKDYILGFIFYKYLSEAQIRFAKKNGLTEDEIKNLNEDDDETVDFIRKEIGYFISYKDLFANWLSIGSDFSVANVHEALSAFNRLISPYHKKLFQGIFNTLETGLSKLGENAASQTKAISNLLQLIKDIPMDGRQDYDVLGFIYEYLIEKFAANAGKKAGEFYTPHEVSLLMSDIMAHHLKDRREIQIYDPTSGSGSLLINIGKSVARYMNNKDNIKYYAQELKQNTYNLTRMNLIMRGIKATNIETRNGDTLEEDWPYFDEADPANSYNPLYLDAVVSNPPYSQPWDPKDKAEEPRYSEYGVAPKSKADFAFLLHDLYHLKPDGIMTIVLPHGVLFRGGEEGIIRSKLIEKDNIEAIIGLPANIFFGTGIPTVIIVLRQNRKENTVLVVDASKGFKKEGKNNKLRASDIKRIVDTVIARRDVPKYAKLVSKKELRDNEYNLNIPRYVDSNDETESWDVYATMFGGIPQNEIDGLANYWKAFPSLRTQLFAADSNEMAQIKTEDVLTVIQNNKEVQNFINDFDSSLKTLPISLKEKLVDNLEQLQISREEGEISKDLFSRINNIPLLDQYQAYQIFHDQWEIISGDVEILQTEGLDAAKQVDPNLVIKKVKGKDTEVQEGWKGHVFPFQLVQQTYLLNELQELTNKQNHLITLATKLEDILESLSEETKDNAAVNETKDAFVAKEITKAAKDIATDIKNGTVYTADDDEPKIVQANKLLTEEKTIKKAVTDLEKELHLTTKKTIENLTYAQVHFLLQQKWITPMLAQLNQMPTNIIDNLVQKVEYLATKYQTTLVDVDQQIQQTQASLVTMMDELTGTNHDMQGVKALQNLLKNENYGTK